MLATQLYDLKEFLFTPKDGQIVFAQTEQWR
jgi:hypothetical protein